MAASNFLTGTHHCAIFDGKEHGATHRQFKECTLHPGHKKFMTVDECRKKKPSEIGLHDKEMPHFRNRIDRTVRVVVYRTSVNRPDTFMNSENSYPCKEIRGIYNKIRYGTGYLHRRCNVGDDDDNGNNDEDKDNNIDDNNNNNIDNGGGDTDNSDDGYDDDNNVPFFAKIPCPCKTSTCQTSNRKSYYFTIRTATHVIFDEQEAHGAKFELFYDSEDRSNVVMLCGITVLGTRDLRWQTDCCTVVCVTHDGSLADELSRLCEVGGYLCEDNVMVSHPHGVSKRISVGNRPDTTIVVVPNKKSVQLKKGTEIRIPDCHDTRIVEDINRLLNKRVIDCKSPSNTFVLDCDLEISRPEGVAMDTDWDDYFDDKPKNKVWCNIFHPGTQLIADNGKRYTFPYNDDKAPGVKMEVFVETKYFIDKEDKDNHSVFVYERYDIASCPGSSGARVGYYGYYSIYGPIGHVHFGNCGDFNTSSLYCIHTPDGDEQDYKTMRMMGAKWYEYHSEDRRVFYDLITEI